MIQIPIALQAYSLRKIYQENPLQALKLIKEAGYDGSISIKSNNYQTLKSMLESLGVLK